MFKLPFEFSCPVLQKLRIAGSESAREIFKYMTGTDHKNDLIKIPIMKVTVVTRESYWASYKVSLLRLQRNIHGTY